MSQLIENKRNHPVLIANFEPNEIAIKAGQKTKIQTRIQTRKHCADDPAQKVGVRINRSEEFVVEDNGVRLAFVRRTWL
jgi:hypothetical protein